MRRVSDRNVNSEACEFLWFKSSWGFWAYIIIQCKSNCLQMKEQRSEVLLLNPLKRGMMIPVVLFPNCLLCNNTRHNVFKSFLIYAACRQYYTKRLQLNPEFTKYAKDGLCRLLRTFSIMKKKHLNKSLGLSLEKFNSLSQRL